MAEDPVKPIIDPTANVLKLVEEAIKRQDDLRGLEARMHHKLAKQESQWRDKLDNERKTSDRSERREESARINALLEASTQNVALALEKQSAQAQAQDRRIAVLEQNQYQTGGRDIQRTEGRLSTQWAVGLAVFVAGILVSGVVAIIALLLRS